jgi:hypothetical protein
MSTRRFENFTQRLNGRVTEDPRAERPEDLPPTPDEPDTPEKPDSPEEDETMPDETPVEQTEAYKAGFNAANDRSRPCSPTRTQLVVKPMPLACSVASR